MITKPTDTVHLPVAEARVLGFAARNAGQALLPAADRALLEVLTLISTNTADLPTILITAATLTTAWIEGWHHADLLAADLEP
jgi:hypothetical protein